MPPLTKDRNTTRKDGGLAAYGVAANAKIFAGSLVCLNTDGYAAPGANTAGFKFVGVAKEYVDNTGGANGAKNVTVWRNGAFDFTAAGMAITDVGSPVFVSDDQTVAKVTTIGVGCGIITEVESATKVWVDIHESNRRTGRAQDSIASADGVAAAGATPTKAEFDAVVTLVNEIKTVVNGLLSKLGVSRIIGS